MAYQFVLPLKFILSPLLAAWPLMLISLAAQLPRGPRLAILSMLLAVAIIWLTGTSLTTSPLLQKLEMHDVSLVRFRMLTPSCFSPALREGPTHPSPCPAWDQVLIGLPTQRCFSNKAKRHSLFSAVIDSNRPK
jgi:hypothetical protein